MRAWILGLSAALLLGACSKNYWVSPDFKQASSDSLVVYVKNPTLNNVDDITDDLGAGDPMLAFQDLFGAELRKDLMARTRFKNIQVQFGNYNEEGQTLQNDSKSMYVQKRKTDTASTQMTLYLSNFSVQRESEWRPGGPNNPAGYNSVFLSLKGSYSWTQANSTELVAGGMFKGTSSFAFAMTREDWERATLDLAKQTLKGTPILIQNTSY